MHRTAPPPASDYYLVRSFFTTPIAIPTTPAQKNTISVSLPVIVVITLLTTSISAPTAVVIVFVLASANKRHFPFLDYFIVISEIKALPLYPQP